MLGLITRRRHEQELAAAKAKTDRQRAAAEAAASRATTAEYNRRQLLRQLAEADAATRRLHGRVEELGRRLAALAEADPEYTAQLEHRVARLQKVGVRILAAGAAERRRADRLQDRLDDALGLNTPAVEDGRQWQTRRQDGGRKAVAS
ncbi:hypothetical protein ACH49_13510 [Streptomyces leeuwenhoekii]|uniref:Mobilization protein n=1 Tax=Streptomyces leeuwenhoekii TaxID=1437453 RepID=A0ABR5HZ27_STRLW|nr:hypothetical protein [Streptomyces leeuwenhoekii]KMS79071.1 hypothetical protein ACH49_13510 [Streptomyces leeuwenhoekii]